MNLRQLKRDSAALHHQLSQKNDYKMTEMISYLRGKDLSTQRMEELRHELLEMAVTAEREGRAPETDFGFDLREYVDRRVSAIPPMTAAESAYELFSLWGFAVVVLTGSSLLFDWLFDFVGIASGETAAGNWTVTYSELIMLLMIIGIALTLGRLFTTHKLEKDPDFFSKGSRNHLGDFLRIYGLTLFILLAGFVLMFLLKDRILFTLPLTTGTLLWLLVLLAFVLIRQVLGSRARGSLAAR